MWIWLDHTLLAGFKRHHRLVSLNDQVRFHPGRAATYHLELLFVERTSRCLLHKILLALYRIDIEVLDLIYTASIWELWIIRGTEGIVVGGGYQWRELFGVGPKAHWKASSFLNGRMKVEFKTRIILG